MLYKLSSENREELLRLPESGLGFQVITAVNKSVGLWQRLVVFNAEIAIEYNKDLEFYTNTLIGYCYEMLIDSLSVIELTKISLIESDDDQNIEKQISNKNKAIPFVRPSIYKIDNRIDKENETLIPGTTVTSIKCFRLIKRYKKNMFNTFVLPQQEEIRNLYYILATEEDVIFKGEFQPLFGNNGGGEKFITNQKTALISKTRTLPIGSAFSTEKISNLNLNL